MSSVSSITPNSANTSAAVSQAFSNPKSALTQNDFLKLLVAQIQYQDPMNPKTDTDMAAQMAQFTSLQQTTEMSSSLAMLQANSLIGSTVKLQIDSQTSTSGVVSAVTMNNGIPQITVNGYNYLLSQVQSVTPPPAATTPTNTTAN